MTLSELRAAVRRQTLEPSSELSDASLNDMLNEGYRIVAVADRWPWLRSSAQISTTVDKREYDISSDVGVSDFMFIDSVVDNDQKDGMLSQLSFEQYLMKYGGDPDSGSRAHFFYLINDDTLGLVPVPTSSETDAYTLNYFKTPTLLSADGDSPEWAEPLHHILIDFAVSKIWEREEYFTERDLAFQRFVLGVGELKRFYNLRSKDRPIVFGDGIGGNFSSVGRGYLTFNLPFD